MNFRADRIRQLAYSFAKNDFNFFIRKKLNLCTVLSAVEYSSSLEGKVNILLKPIKIDNYLSEVLSHNDKKQLKLAETEKYAHVTYFFNAGQEHKLKGEDWMLIPSPKVNTYDKCPEMSAEKITQSHMTLTT